MDENSLRSQWRQLVFERDHSRCRTCGERCHLHLAHVIDKTEFKYIESSYFWENLVTLCNQCHMSYHRSRRGFKQMYNYWRVRRVHKLFSELRQRYNLRGDT